MHFTRDLTRHSRKAILWRASRRSDALLAAADALEAVERFSPTDSRQAERSHQYARAIIGLFFGEVDDERSDEKPPFTFGDASALEANTAQLVGVDLKPLADNWRILATVEASIGADIGIDVRSMSKQAGPLVGTTELLLLQGRYERSVRSQLISESLQAGAAVVSAAKAIKDIPRGVDGLPRIEVTELTAADPKVLASDPSVREMVQSLLLDAIVYRVIVARELLNSEFFVELQRSSEIIFGDDPDLVTIINTASGNASVSSASSMSAIYAYAAAISAQSVRSDPALRFYRDMMMTGRIATSLARGALAPAFVREIAEGWQHVLDHQRFRLRNPASHMPAIEAALEEMKPPTLAKTAALLLAAAPAVGYRYGNGWQELLTGIFQKSSPAHLPRHLLFAIIAYRIQADRCGDLDHETKQVLDRTDSKDTGAAMSARLVSFDQKRTELTPGTVLVREWNRQSQRVMVMAEGFAWNGQTYDSLSKVAFAITGTRWNGPRFFGLRDKEYRSATEVRP